MDTHFKVWDEFIYPFPNVNGAIIEIWEWIGNIIPQLTGYVIIFSMLGFKLNHVGKTGQGGFCQQIIF